MVTQNNAFIYIFLSSNWSNLFYFLRLDIFRGYHLNVTRRAIFGLVEIRLYKTFYCEEKRRVLISKRRENAIKIVGPLLSPIISYHYAFRRFGAKLEKEKNEKCYKMSTKPHYYYYYFLQGSEA